MYPGGYEEEAAAFFIHGLTWARAVEPSPAVILLSLVDPAKIDALDLKPTPVFLSECFLF